MKRPSLSIVIPTCAGSTTTRLSSGKQPYQFREYLLRCFTLPRLRDDLFVSEIIVVGEFEPGLGYTYLPVPNVHGDNIHDALAQRDAGCRAATGEWIGVLADDHYPEAHCFGKAWKYLGMGDVVSLARQTRMRNGAGERLNNGSSGPAPYANGHGTLYRRDVLEHCPWSDVPRVWSFDVAHTRQIQAEGFNIIYADDAAVEDVEWGARPWL